MTPVGALEIGGSHVAIAMVERGSATLREYARFALDSAAPLTSFLATIGDAVAGLGAGLGAVEGRGAGRGAVPRPKRWVVAIPGPFDYGAGVGGVHPAGKLAALAGIDVRAALTPLLATDDITFVNDATAFALGCFHDSLMTHRLLALTLGSGIGSTFVEDGRVLLDDRVPPAGEVYCLPAAAGSPDLTIEGRFGPAALAAARGFDSFRALSAYARTHPATAQTLRSDFIGLADALGPWLTRFRPDTVAVGGGVCHAWDLFGDAFTAGLTQHAGTRLRVVAVPDTEPVALRGAAALVAGVQ